MSYDECVDKKIIFKTAVDPERANSLIKLANLRLEFLSSIDEDKFLFKKIEEYYEVIKELTLAHMYNNGFNCSNHICLIAYLKHSFKDFEFEVNKIDELRKVRNEISYRGFVVRSDYLKRNELEFLNIIRVLRSC